MSGRRLTCTHKIDSAAHTGFWLTCAQKSVSVVHTEPSGDWVGPVNVIIFLAVQQTQKLLILVQLPVGWGGVITFMFLCTHTGTATLSSFLLSSRHCIIIIIISSSSICVHNGVFSRAQPSRFLRAQPRRTILYVYVTPQKNVSSKKESGDFPANQVRQIILRWQKGRLRRAFSPKTLTTSPNCVKGWRWSESWKEPETLVQTRNNRCGFPSSNYLL